MNESTLYSSCLGLTAAILGDDLFSSPQLTTRVPPEPPTDPKVQAELIDKAAEKRARKKAKIRQLMKEGKV